MSSSLFEKQYAHRRKLPIPSGVEYVEVVPARLSDPVPILLVPGWGGTLELQKACVREMYTAGRRVIALRHATVLAPTDKEAAYPEIVMQKTQTILTILQQLSIAKVDVISHSEGSLCTAVAATLEPKLFRSLVLLSPAGISGKSIGPRIVAGFVWHNVKSQAKDIPQAVRLLKAMAKSSGDKPAIADRLRTLRKEVAAITSFGIYPLLTALQQQGIKVAMLAGEHDVVFPLRKMERYLRAQAPRQKYYGFSLFATKPGGHELHIDAPAVTAMALGILDKLNRE